MPIDEGEATLPVSREVAGETIQTNCELQIRSDDGKLEILPILRSEIVCNVGDSQVRFNYSGGALLFRNLTPHQPAYKDGQAVESARLEVGSYLEFSNHRILYWDNGQPAAFLKGCSAPYAGEIWPLNAGENPVGRPGRRVNAVRIDHPTVSREHATIFCREGVYHLLSESASSPVCVSGQPIEAGSEVTLNHGDIMEFGETMLRFHNRPAESNPTNCGLVKVRSLGGFQVEIAGSVVTDKEWKTQQIKWMFAHLAYLWGRPLAIEALAEELWPDFTWEQCRNNLNYSVSTLRQTIRTRLPEAMRGLEILMRSSSTLQLNPDILDQHDVVRLQRHLELVSKDTSGHLWEQHAERAVMTYSGPFLNDCYLDWVSPIRQALEVEIMEAGNKLLEARSARENWEALIPVASQLLVIDPLSESTCLHLTQALASSGRVQQALKVSEQFQEKFQKELGQEPEIGILREYQRLKSLA